MISRTITLGNYEFVVLAVMAAENRPFATSDVRELIRIATGERVSLGALNTALGRLVAKEYVSSEVGKREYHIRGPQEMRLFMVSDKGRVAIQNFADRVNRLMEMARSGGIRINPAVAVGERA